MLATPDIYWITPITPTPHTNKNAAAGRADFLDPYIYYFQIQRGKLDIFPKIYLPCIPATYAESSSAPLDRFLPLKIAPLTYTF